ncbi:MAG TPA: prepilin-type N-terminal cleavage/methylation domain-containing protein [Gemmatimonadota bacterium]|nr:prepilin-type N-terminal cleavage/methylation domain-containing protein [Gemmatimonadota bacterium]
MSFPRIGIRPVGEHGSTLIEVMIALVVFLIGSLAIAAFLLVALRAQSGAGRRGQADQLLQAKIEELQSTAYAEVVDGSDAESLGGAVFQRAWDVTEDEPVPRVKTILLETSWEERGRDFSVHATTLRSAE